MMELTLEKPAISDHFTIKRSKDFQEPKGSPLGEIENEFTGQNILILTPYEKGLEGKSYISSYERESIAKELAYFSRTRDVEVGTERTEILEGVVQKMLRDNPEVKTRVIIMNKGQGPEAFVLPDGSVFIGQSLLNELGSLDEVAGVLAHELGHLINKTSQRKTGDPTKDLGIGWIHEAASDDKVAPDLLEKANLNSVGLKDAIIKISGSHRGEIHQSGLSRGSQIVGAHTFIHFKTSSKENTQIPSILKKDSVKRTNLEMGYEFGREGRFEDLARVLPLLHVADLYSIYKDVWERELFDSDDTIIRKRECVKVFHSLFIKQLSEKGFTPSDIHCYFLLSQNSLGITDFSMIPKPQMLVDAIDRFSDFNGDYGYTFRRMQETLFGESVFEYFSDGNPPICQIVDNIKYKFYNPVYSKDSHGIPVATDSLLSIAEKISSLSESSWGSRNPRQVLSDLINSYINVLSKNKEYREQDKKNAEITYLLTRIKDLKIPVYLNQISYGQPEEIRQIITDILGTEDLNHLIDQFFQEFNIDRQKEFFSFLYNFRSHLKGRNISDTERKKYLDYFVSKVDYLNFSDLEEKSELTKKIIKFNMLSIVGLTLFEEDVPAFYEFMGKAMSSSGIDVDKLTREDLAQLGFNLLSMNRFVNRGLEVQGKSPDIEVNYTPIEIRDYDRYLQLPFLKRIVGEYGTPLIFSSIKDLHGYTRKIMSDYSYTSGNSPILFSDKLMGVVLGQSIRKNFVDLLQKGVPEEEMDHLYEFLSSYYPNEPKRNRFLKEIRKRYLYSEKIDLHQKIDYLIRNYDEIGDEATLLVADQIHTLDDYIYFREKIGQRLLSYLDVSSLTTEIAAIDFIGSRFVSRWEALLGTIKADDETKRSVSTEIAEEWIIGASHNYNPELKKISISDSQRSFFRSLSDSFASVKDLSFVQRFALVHKALVDTGGALTSNESKKELGKITVDSVPSSSSFVSSALRIGIEVGPPEFMSFPVAQMLAGRLFEALDLDKVDIAKLQNSHHIKKFQLKKEDIDALLRSSTRDVILFGESFHRNQDWLISRMANESNDSYQSIAQLLKKILFSSPNAEVKQKEYKLSISEEAIIGAVEMSGALGVRSLQLARQLGNNFSPEVDERLSDSLDSRPGLNKLAFWENLFKIYQQGESEDLRKFLRERLLTVDHLLGGGSLYTTFAGTVKDSEGNPRKIVVKLLNPNPELFIRAGWKTAQKVLSQIEDDKKQSRQDKEYAEKGKMFIDLAQEWCLRDINDATFEGDDDQFRQTVEGFNAEKERDLFYAPRRIINTYRVKSEEEAEGRTVNKFLNDPAVNSQQKQQVVSLIEEFYVYQLKHPDSLVHSDPHIGNFIVSFEDGMPKIGVIDRNMYLRLSRNEKEAFAELLETGDYKSFVPKFVDNVIERNKNRNPISRQALKYKILIGMKMEYDRQKKSKEGVNNFSLLKKLLSDLNREKLDIPLELRLMIRNIEAFRKLSERYNA